MSTASNEGDRIPMSQRERDRLRVLHSVLDGQRTQAEAARLLRLPPRQVRRLVQRLQQGGDAALVHGLRGKPSNHGKDAKLRRQVLRLYRQEFHDFGPTFAAEKLAERGLEVSSETLRRWLLAEGLWQRQRRRDQHRSRRLIRARSPQAKGRVERSFGTAQDRVVKDWNCFQRGGDFECARATDGGQRLHPTVRESALSVG